MGELACEVPRRKAGAGIHSRAQHQAPKQYHRLIPSAACTLGAARTLTPTQHITTNPAAHLTTAQVPLSSSACSWPPAQAESPMHTRTSAGDRQPASERACRRERYGRGMREGEVKWQREGKDYKEQEHLAGHVRGEGGRGCEG